MNKSKIKHDILMCLMETGVAFPQTIIEVLRGNNTIANNVTYLIKNGYVQRRNLTVKTSNYKSYTVSYITITRKAVQWLVDKYNDSYLPYIPNPVPRFQVTDIRTKEMMYRILKSSTAAIIFNSMDIEISGQQRNETSDSVYFTDMIQQAKERYIKAKEGVIGQYKGSNGNIIGQNNQKLIMDDQKLTFYPSRTIRDSFTLTEEEVQQYKFSTHIGLLANRSKSYLVYMSYTHGTSFRKQAVDRAQLSAKTLLRRQGLDVGLSMNIGDGIILFKNIRELDKTFKKLIQHEQKADDELDIERKLSDIFGHMYGLVIKNRDIKVLERVLKDGDGLRKEVCRYVLDNDIRFEEKFDNIMELRMDDIPAFVGVDMDLCRIQYAYRKILNNPDTSIIICYEHQVDAYQRIMPNNKVMYFTVKL